MDNTAVVAYINRQGGQVASTSTGGMGAASQDGTDDLVHFWSGRGAPVCGEFSQPNVLCKDTRPLEVGIQVADGMQICVSSSKVRDTMLIRL